MAMAGLALLFFSSILPTGPARADEAHYRNIVVGDRAAGMGGAFTAVSDNPSGCFYNPAGIAFVSGGSLSATVNAYQYSTKSYKDALLGTDGTRSDWEQTSSVLLPNFFGVLMNVGDGKLGFSYTVPDSTQRRQSQHFTNVATRRSDGVSISDYYLNIDDRINIYEFGPTYAHRLGENFSLGATLYAQYRDGSIIRNQLLLMGDNSFEWINFYDTKTEWGVRPVVGVIWSPFSKIDLGLSVSKIETLSTDHRSQTAFRFSSTDPGFVASDGTLLFEDPKRIFLNRVSDEDKTEHPWTSTLGIAYFHSPYLLVSGDLSYNTAVSNINRGVIKKEVVNAAVGVEYYISEAWAVRAGAYTDMANTPDLAAGAVNQPEHIDIYGTTLSLSRFTRFTSLTFGLGYAMGDGEAQVKLGNTEIQDAEIRNLSFFVSATSAF